MFHIAGAIPISWRDLLDIAVVTVLIYYVLSFVRGTRAVAALQGILVLVAIYMCSRVLGLLTLSWLLETLFNSIFLVIVILFSTDIRQALASIDLKRVFRGSGFLKVFRFLARGREMREKAEREEKLRNIRILADTMTELASVNIGAIVVLERSMELGDYHSKGEVLDARLSRDLLYAIFYPKNPLHDGAAIVSAKMRINAAGCILPLSQMSERQKFGTRHRAAIGVTEVSDAISIVVSEERGQVTVAQNGRLSNPLTRERLEKILTNARL